MDELPSGTEANASARGGGAPNAPRGRIVVVTGRSGAGRRTAISRLEDIGFQTVDTPPIWLAPEIARAAARAGGGRLAIGVDARTAGFSAAAFAETLSALRAIEGTATLVLFLDSSDRALLRRYNETRRRHPLSPTTAIEEGLRRDADEMAPVRAAADMVIDTSDMTPRALGRVLQDRFGEEDGLSLAVISFAYRGGLPAEADFVFDCRFLRNPHYEPALRPRDGRDAEVAAFVAADPQYEDFMSHLEAYPRSLLPAFAAEGRSYVSVAFGCTGGRHRSVAVAEAFAALARRHGLRPSVRHREQAGDGARAEADAAASAAQPDGSPTLSDGGLGHD